LEEKHLRSVTKRVRKPGSFRNLKNRPAPKDAGRNRCRLLRYSIS
jgi:hypothetical protein